MRARAVDGPVLTEAELKAIAEVLGSLCEPAEAPLDSSEIAARDRRALLGEAERLRAEVAELQAPSAAELALDEIAEICGCPEWEYPQQVVRDVVLLRAELDGASAEERRLLGRLGEARVRAAGALHAERTRTRIYQWATEDLARRADALAWRLAVSHVDAGDLSEALARGLLRGLGGAP